MAELSKVTVGGPDTFGGLRYLFTSPKNVVTEPKHLRRVINARIINAQA